MHISFITWLIFSPRHLLYPLWQGPSCPFISYMFRAFWQNVTYGNSVIIHSHHQAETHSGSLHRQYRLYPSPRCFGMIPEYRIFFLYFFYFRLSHQRRTFSQVIPVYGYSQRRFLQNIHLPPLDGIKEPASVLFHTNFYVFIGTAQP